MCIINFKLYTIPNDEYGIGHIMLFQCVYTDHMSMEEYRINGLVASLEYNCGRQNSDSLLQNSGQSTINLIQWYAET